MFHRLGLGPGRSGEWLTGSGIADPEERDAGQVEITKDKRGEYRFRLEATNGQTVAVVTNVPKAKTLARRKRRPGTGTGRTVPEPSLVEADRRIAVGSRGSTRWPLQAHEFRLPGSACSIPGPPSTAAVDRDLWV